VREPLGEKLGDPERERAPLNDAGAEGEVVSEAATELV
jgi:hypothetical protein